MKKCEKCGKEVVLPFVCTYCGKDYCDEHRLPESHECSNQPTEAPPYTSPIAENQTPKTGSCPKCHLAQSDMIDYDAETMTFKCRGCGFKYGQMKAFPHDYVETGDKIETDEKRSIPQTTKSKKNTGRRSTKALLGGLLAGLAITLLGLGIIYWEIHNGLFWTIVFVSFIPIPLVLIGGFFVALGSIIGLVSLARFVGSLPPTRKVVSLLFVALILGTAIWNMPFIISTFQRIVGPSPSPNYSYEELVNYALSLINSERQSKNLQNVSLSDTHFAQQHANEMLKYHFMSHWDLHGYKPHMRYTKAGGRGSVSENVAWVYYSTPTDAKEAVSKLEEDLELSYFHWCNIVTPFHNKVDIGIAYDNFNFYLVQDFENSYIAWDIMAVSNNKAAMKGTIQEKGLSIEDVAIYYDKPINLTVEQLESPLYNGSYDMGTYVGMALPSGWEAVGGITITAEAWSQTGQNFQISFDLSPAFAKYGKGVYTLCLDTNLTSSLTQDNSLTSYSVWN